MHFPFLPAHHAQLGLSLAPPKVELAVKTQMVQCSTKVKSRETLVGPLGSNLTFDTTHWVLVTQSCPTLCGPMDCSPPGSSVHRILQARIVEWVAMPVSRESSQPRDQTCICYVFCIGRQVLHL